MPSIAGNIIDLKILKRLLRYALPYRGIMITAFIVIVTLGLITPLRPWLIQHTVDDTVLKPDKQMLLFFSLLILVVVLVEAVLQFAEEYYTGLLGQKVIRDIRVHLFSHITGLRTKFFDHTPIGTLVTRVVSDIETIADIFSEGLLVIAGDLLQIICIISVMFYLNWELTLISLTSVPLLLIATYIFKNAIKNVFQEVRTQVARLNAFVQEHITGMSIVRIFNREKPEFEKFISINSVHKKAHIRSVLYYSIFFPVVEVLSAISIGALVWWGTKGVLEDKFTLGSIISFILYIYMMFRPMRQLADRFNTLQMGMVSSERVFKLLDNNDVIRNSDTTAASTVTGNIEFRNVWFTYDDIGRDIEPGQSQKWVLKDISFTARPGETIAIVGATGAGKTSIINILGRFYEFQKGKIFLDGTDITRYELNSLRRVMSVVSQNVFLFSDTIFNNITLKNPHVSRHEVITAAKAIGVNDFFVKLPGQYDYNVRERGVMLSAGQRQLIAFIRAYVQNPKILILDEATSFVDTETELLVQQATESLIQNRTSVIIAHRLATVQRADNIIVMDAGKIVEAGKHAELLRKNGTYRKLYDLQFESITTPSLLDVGRDDGQDAGGDLFPDRHENIG